MAGVVTRRVLFLRRHLNEIFINTSQRQCSLTSSDAVSTGSFPEENKDLSRHSQYKIELAETRLKTDLANPSITTLTELVKYSTDLQRLVSLGVRLRDIEKHDGATELLANIKYYPNVQEIVTLLNAVGVDEVGDMISRFPFILAEGADAVKLKLMYLSSRKFSRSQIARIITGQPSWLFQDITEIDAKLGAAQQTFGLSDHELRDVVSRSPKIALINTLILQRFKLILSVAYNCEHKIIKKIIVGCPSAARIGEHSLRNRMDYLTQTMKLSVEDIVAWPSILRCRERILQERHSVLAHLNTAEYDNTKPGYVSLQRLVSRKDDEFCKHVAKIPLQLYYDYIKTL